MNSLLPIVLLAATAAASILSNEVQDVLDVPEVAEAYTADMINENGYQMEAVPESRQNLNIGVVGPDDRLIARVTHNVAAAAFVIHDQDVTIRGAEYTNITAIWVVREGATQNAVPSIKAGGLGQNYVTIGIRGVRGRGFSYTISIHSTINCSNS